MVQGEADMKDCVFCKIVAGTEPASVVYEDNRVMAFMDLGQVNPGHVLVIPKVHFAYLSDLDEEVGAKLFKITMRIAVAIRKSGVKCEGINLFVADGEVAFQEIFHFHLHIIPRFKGDGFEIKARPKRSSRAELDKLANAIKKVLKK